MLCYSGGAQTNVLSQVPTVNFILTRFFGAVFSMGTHIFLPQATFLQEGGGAPY